MARATRTPERTADNGTAESGADKHKHHTDKASDHHDTDQSPGSAAAVETGQPDRGTSRNARRSMGAALGPLRRLRAPAAAMARAGERQAAGALIGVGNVVGRVPRKQLALYAGLGAAAAVSVIEWPVAVAVAAGAEVARRSARSSRAAGSKRPVHNEGGAGAVSDTSAPEAA